MLATRCKFRTATVSSGSAIIRICTGQEVPNLLHEDDCAAYDKSLGEDTVIIYSRKDVFQQVRSKLIAVYIIAFLSFVSMCLLLYRCFSIWITQGYFSLNILLVTVGASAYLFIVMLHQGLHPVVHDAADHWVDLKTGSSNLCGGIVIRRKARWV